MKIKSLVIAIVLAVCVQGAVFAKGIIEERNAYEYNTLVEQVNAYIETDDYAATIPLFKRMHELKPMELEPVEYLGILYINLPEERPALTNAMFWLTEAEKRGSSNNLIYYNLACIHSLNGDVEKAETAMDKAIVLGWSNFENINQDDDLVNFRTGSWWKGIADNYMRIEHQLALFNEFVDIEEEKNIKDRITFYSGIVVGLKELVPNMPVLRCMPLFYLASSYKNMGDYAKAEPYFLEVKAVREQTLGRNHPDYTKSLNNLVSLYSNMEDYAKTEPYLLELKVIMEQTSSKNYRDYVLTLTNLGVLYFHFMDMVDYARAEPYLLEATVIGERELGKNDPDYALSLNNLGSLYQDMGDYAKAESYILEAKTIREQVLGKNHHDYVISVNNLGLLYKIMAEYAKAESYYLEAKIIYEQELGKNHPDYTTLLSNLGGLYKDMGDYAKAEIYYMEAKTIREQTLVKNPRDYAITLNNLGVLYHTMRDYDKAEAYYQKTKIIREQVLKKDHPHYAAYLNNLGNLYKDKRDFAKAEQYLLEAKAIMEQVLGKNHPDYAITLSGIGSFYGVSGDYDKAEQYFLEVKAIMEQALGKNHPDYGTSLGNISVFYQSIEDYEKAEAYNKELSELRINLINQNFSFMSEQQRSLYLETVSRGFESSYSLSLKYPIETVNGLNYTNTLFIKGLLLRTTNAIRDAIYSSGDAALIGEFEELGRLRQQINRLQQKEDTDQVYLHNLEAEAEEKDKKLTGASAEYRNLKEDIAMKWEKVRDSLQPGEAAVEFVSFQVYDKKWTDTVQYAALVLKPDSTSPIWIPLCEEVKLQEILNKAEGKGLEDISKTEIIYNTYGAALYSLVWESLEQELKDVTAIYYSPSGLLHKIAFGALPTGDDEEEDIDFENFDFEGDDLDKDTRRRLADKYDLNLVSSTREVVHLSRGQTEAVISQAVLYGYLDYMNNEGETVSRLPRRLIRELGGYERLENTEEEALTVQEYLNRKQITTTLYLGSEGSEESFKALNGMKTGLIYLATHGFFLADVKRSPEEMEQARLGNTVRVVENPLLRSGLLLAGGNKAWTNIHAEDEKEEEEKNDLTNNRAEWVDSGGILTADMIAGMDLLGTKLVVLSACQTGLGKAINKEGVFGLQRAFKLAGVETLIMSLWKVAETSSAKLMSVFLQEWLFSGKSRQEAFKEAQRQVRAEYPEPYHWAAFVMLD